MEQKLPTGQLNYSHKNLSLFLKDTLIALVNKILAHERFIVFVT